MDRDVSRRSFLRLTGALGIGAAGLGTQVTSVEAASDRYIVDTSTADDSTWRDSVEIVHDLPQIDMAVARGDESALSGLRYGPDTQIELDLPEPVSVENHEDTTLDDDQFTPYQWDKMAQNSFALHDQGITGNGAKVAVIDTGVMGDHPDLQANVVHEESVNTTAVDTPEGYPSYFDVNGHGTHVASIIGAADNGVGVVGSAPDVDIVAVRVFEGGGGAYGSDIIAGQVHAVDVGCDAANLSLGGYPYPPGLSAQISKEMDERVAQYGLDNDCLMVAAAGNDDSNLDADGDVLSLPNQADGYMSVSATGPIGFVPGGGLSSLDSPTHTPAVYTNYGSEAVDVSAAGGNGTGSPANNVLGVYGNVSGLIGYYWLAGTSMAAPQVAGLVALIKSQNPDASAERIKYHIERTADHVEYDYSNVPYFQPDAEVDGWGRGNSILEDAYSSELYRGNGHIDVEQAATEAIPFPEPLEVDGHTIAPRDPDGDGHFEDVNGDGEVDMDDVHALFALFMSGTSLSPAEEAALDFDGDGGFDQFDVQELLDQVRA